MEKSGARPRRGYPNSQRPQNTQSVTADLAEMINANRADAARDEVAAKLQNMCHNIHCLRVQQAH